MFHSVRWQFFFFFFFFFSGGGHGKLGCKQPRYPEPPPLYEPHFEPRGYESRGYEGQGHAYGGRSGPTVMTEAELLEKMSCLDFSMICVGYFWTMWIWHGLLDSDAPAQFLWGSAEVFPVNPMGFGFDREVVWPHGIFASVT